jgi:hypothetical protein
VEDIVIAKHCIGSAATSQRFQFLGEGIDGRGFVVDIVSRQHYEIGIGLIAGGDCLFEEAIAQAASIVVEVG